MRDGIGKQQKGERLLEDTLLNKCQRCGEWMWPTAIISRAIVVPLTINRQCHCYGNLNSINELFIYSLHIKFTIVAS